MDTELTHARTDALAFLRNHKTGVLATVSADGVPHASTVYYVCDDEFNIYFLTLANSRKFEALSAHPQAAFTVSSGDVPQTLQLEGVAIDITLDQEAAAKRDQLFEVLNSNNWFYAPVSKLDPADSVVVWLKPRWVRWADFAFEENGNRHVFKEIPLNA